MKVASASTHAWADGACEVSPDAMTLLAPFLEKKWNRPLVSLGLRNFGGGDVALQYLRGIGKPCLRGLLHMRR